MLNPKHIEGLISLINTSPYYQLLSMVMEDIGIGYSSIRLDMEQKHLSPYLAIQGGVYSSLIDAAAYWAVYSELDPDCGLITMDVTVHNLASIKSGRMYAKGQRIKIGRTICLAEARVETDEGVILAQGSSKLLVTQGLQTIEQMSQLANVTLPPKFITG
ncbi:MAG: PaaI family thioesterase [Syntrophomonadales bacterium]|jgi:uncharacterized protein (TIGR00369 family)